jgi:hypothetical protein
MLVILLIVDALFSASRGAGGSGLGLLLLGAPLSETTGVIFAANLGVEASVVGVVKAALLQILAVGLLVAEVTDHVLNI